MANKCTQIHNASVFGQCVFIQNGGVFFNEIQIGCDFDQIYNRDYQKYSQPKAKIEVVGIVLVVSHDWKIIFSDVEWSCCHHGAYKKDDEFEEVCSGASIDVVDQANYVDQDSAMQQLKSSEVLHPTLGVERHIRAHA